MLDLAPAVCMRAFAPKLLFDLVEEHEVTHFGGAPAKVLESMNQFGFEVMHVYGLTETYGHILQAAPQASRAKESLCTDSGADLAFSLAGHGRITQSVKLDHFF